MVISSCLLKLFSVTTQFRAQYHTHGMCLYIIMVIHIICTYTTMKGTAVAQRLRCCATNRKVAGSIPDGVIGIFHRHNPPDRTMALGSTQPLIETSTRRISWGKCSRCVRLTTLSLPVSLSWNLGTLTSWKPLGHSRPVTGLIFYIWFVARRCH